MFVELLPLLKVAPVSLSVAVPANSDTIVLTIMPKITDEEAEEFGSIKEAAVKALSECPQTLRAQSAEELDADCTRHSFAIRRQPAHDRGFDRELAADVLQECGWDILRPILPQTKR